jgi:hypothetical protein
MEPEGRSFPMAKGPKAISPKPDTAQDHDAEATDQDDSIGIEGWTFETIASHLAEQEGLTLDDAPVEFWVCVGMKAAQMHYAMEAASAAGAELGHAAAQLGKDKGYFIPVQKPEANREDNGTSDDDGKEDTPF